MVDDFGTEVFVKSRLGPTQNNVFFFQIPTADTWIRDYGPNFLLARNTDYFELAFNDWKFNGWGNRYPELVENNQIPARVQPILSTRRFRPNAVMEGGSFDVNGAGMCLTTEQCLLNPNRNPRYGRQEIEQTLKAHLGITHIIWLGQGIAGNDTDGHVDEVARFVNRRTIVCAREKDRSDANHKPLEDNYRRLKKTRDHRGHSFQIVSLPLPGRVEGADGRLPASYINFYIANSKVLVPVFDHPNDLDVLEIFGELFPERKIIGLDCRSLILGRGALHCLTQQEPDRLGLLSSTRD